MKGLWSGVIEGEVSQKGQKHSVPAFIRARKCEGFSGERMVLIAPDRVHQLRQKPLLQGLMTTKIGFFPEAMDHRHECKTKTDRVSFTYCFKGRGWCELEGRHHDIRPGTLLIAPANSSYAFGADTTDPWTICWFHLVGTDVASLVDEFGVSTEQPLVSLGDDPRWRGLFEEALHTLEEGEDARHVMYSSSVISHLLTGTLLRQQTRPQEPDIKDRISHCIDYMKVHLDQPLTLSALAGMANMSVARFKLHFKRHTGQACMEFFTKLRMDHARHLLKETELNVKTVADRVGYADPFWFSKVFRTSSAIPPSEYRQRCKKS